MCHCYSELHPFHCEEEEGVDLIQISCLDQKKVPNSRPLLTMLTRTSTTTKLPKKMENILRIEAKLEQNTEQKTTLAAASGVLILMAVIGLICLMGKTCHEEKRKKNSTIQNSPTPNFYQSTTEQI